MIKALLKHILPLCILLLSGYNQILAHAHQEVSFYTPIKETIGVEVAKLSGVQSELTSFTDLPTSGSAQKNHKKIVATEFENEEDKLHALKKLLESSEYIAAVLYAFISAFLFLYLCKGLLLCKLFFPISSYRRHIVLQIIRI
jgi:hypothetical protein